MDAAAASSIAAAAAAAVVAAAGRVKLIRRPWSLTCALACMMPWCWTPYRWMLLLLSQSLLLLLL
jgi:hypothetical protein